MSTPNSDIAAITNAAGILELRASGNADLLPPEMARFTDVQVVEALLLSAARLLDHYRSEARS